MKDAGKALGTAALWGGVAGLCYLLNSFNMLDGGGAGLMIFGAFLTTTGIWKIK